MVDFSFLNIITLECLRIEESLHREGQEASARLVIHIDIDQLSSEFGRPVDLAAVEPSVHDFGVSLGSIAGALS